MNLRLIAVLMVACALTAVFAAPRLDFVCLAQQAWHIDDPEYERWSCLHYAAARGDERVIKRMLDYGADIDERNAAGRTPLTEAAKRGELDTVARLLQAGAEVNVYDTEQGFTPLHYAAQDNRPAVVRRLIAAGADVNARNQWNQTALWQAAWQDWHGNTEIAHILAANGARIDVADEKGHTPLHMAARAGHVPMVAYLLDQGASVEHRNDKQRTPLYQAVVGNHVQVAELLLDNDADPNARAGDWVPLQAALQNSHLSMADALYQHGAQNYERYAAQARLDQGYQALRQDDFNSAIQAFDSAIALRPEHPRGYYYRGLAFHRNGEEQKAARDLARALELDPTNTGALEWLGTVYTELGDYRRATQVLERLVSERPDYGRGYYLLSRAMRSLGEFQRAESGEDQACELGYQPACGRG